MVKRISLLALALVLIISASAGAVEPQLISADILTRGDYAALLVETGGLEGEGKPIELLVEKGIMQGYPDGDMYLDQGITRVEAVVLAAKALGLEGYIDAPVGAASPLGEDHWGYNLYTWFVHLGLAEGDPGAVLTKEEGTAFLEKVFSSDAKALQLMDQAQAAQGEIDEGGIRSVMTGNLSMLPREGMEDLEDLPPRIEMSITQELMLPDQLHQVTSMAMGMPELGLGEITTETYLVDGKMYMGAPDLETGEVEWFHYPETLLPDLEVLLEQAQQLEVLPEGLEEFMHYHLLGTTKLDGEEVYVISFYGLIDDYALFFDRALGQLGGLGDLGESLAPLMELIKSVSYWGVQYLKVEDLMLHGGDFNALVLCADEFMGEAVPLKAMVMSMAIEEYFHGAEVAFEVPEEVLAAPELDFPEMEEFPREEITE